MNFTDDEDIVAAWIHSARVNARAAERRLAQPEQYTETRPAVWASILMLQARDDRHIARVLLRIRFGFDVARARWVVWSASRVATWHGFGTR